ncbi:hypothetical protein RJ639_008130 [Escallonia herrerae]|uniref:Pentatricopeptide repeat-containing protein n=1 Tax=Escallonia herrerae TaxID=1293975 RepID=A0AA88VYT7_9ASTE|nr:hypothetical protein RJ639_008130 [Escallonia herrerae]
MTLNLGSPWLSPHSLPSLNRFSTDTPRSNSNTSALLYLLLTNYTSVRHQSFGAIAASSENFQANASLSESENKVSETYDSDLFEASDELINRVSSTAKDASEALELIAEMSRRGGGTVSSSDCCRIISAALDRGNADLALSIFAAMRSSFDTGTAVEENVERWKWSRPDVQTYTLMVRGLAASLRVSDALRMIAYVCHVGVSPGEEVPFGKIVRCPSCMIAVAVAQPQHGLQIVSCSKCRYQYELLSGDIISIQSEEISMDIPAWKRGLRFLQIMKQSIPAAVHSIVVQTPSGMARTNRFATETVNLPAQEGERVTIALAAPSNVYREVGPLKFSPKAPNFYPGEPMCLTNHRDSRESPLLRAPAKNGGTSLLNPSILFPLLAVLGTGDAASGMIDPSLPQLISVAALSSLAIGATLNRLVLPQLNRSMQTCSPGTPNVPLVSLLQLMLDIGVKRLLTYYTPRSRMRNIPLYYPSWQYEKDTIISCTRYFSFTSCLRLPQRFVDAVAIRQQLLSQYDTLQYRIKDLKGAAENEDPAMWKTVDMRNSSDTDVLLYDLEKMTMYAVDLSCGQLEGILRILPPINSSSTLLIGTFRTVSRAVYVAKGAVAAELCRHKEFSIVSARRSRVERVREGLETSLKSRIELIESYARISSMIEIEVEMDSDVLAAEAASNVESVAEQIQQIMELENLEERWRIQAEANDEVERLLSSEPLSAERLSDG